MTATRTVQSPLRKASSKRALGTPLPEHSHRPFSAPWGVRISLCQSPPRPLITIVEDLATTIGAH